jgi:hypothetical protein
MKSTEAEGMIDARNDIEGCRYSDLSIVSNHAVWPELDRYGILGIAEEDDDLRIQMTRGNGFPVFNGVGYGILLPNSNFVNGC